MSIVTIINIISIVNNTEMYGLKYVEGRSHIVFLAAPPQKQQTNPTKEHRKSFAGNQHV